MIFQDINYSPNSTFITTHNNSFSYGEVLSNSDKIYKNLESDIVLILCDKTIDTIQAYIGALRNNQVPLLVDYEIKETALRNIFDAYMPRYICLPIAKKTSFTETQSISEKIFGNYKMIEFDFKKKKIDKDLAILILTSGSTGDPKSVRISKNNIEKVTLDITSYLKLDKNCKSLILLPLHYSYGLSVLHNALFTGSSIHLTEKTIIDKTLWDDCVNFDVTDISGVPFVLEIMKRINIDKSFFNNLRCLTQAGGRLIPDVTEYFLKLSQKYKFDYFTMYGQTEASPRISYVPPQDGLKKLGTVGIAIDGGEVFIDKVGNKTGEGELVYKGENVCLGYASDLFDLSKGDELKNILYTGDIARIDNQDFITILGRKKRFVKLKGISVNLDYIESFLQKESINSMVIGKDDKLVILFQKESEQENKINLIKQIVKQNFSFHPSLVTIIETELLYMSSGKPNYNKLMEIFLK